MKEKRNLSGIYYRFQEEDGSLGNRCFEDLPEEKQLEIMMSYSKERLISLVQKLSETLNDIGEQLNIYA